MAIQEPTRVEPEPTRVEPEPTRMVPLKGLHSNGGLLVLPANIRLGGIVWRW
jgi:hypothetical protein